MSHLFTFFYSSLQEKEASANNFDKKAKVCRFYFIKDASHSNIILFRFRPYCYGSREAQQEKPSRTRNRPALGILTLWNQSLHLTLYKSLEKRQSEDQQNPLTPANQSPKGEQRATEGEAAKEEETGKQMGTDNRKGLWSLRPKYTAEDLPTTSKFLKGGLIDEWLIENDPRILHGTRQVYRIQHPHLPPSLQLRPLWQETLETGP